MTAVDMAYKSLLSKELPRAIRSEKEYRKCLVRVDELLNVPHRSAAESRYLELLAILIDRYEEEHDPIVTPTPLEVLKELMAANNMNQSALARLFGSSGIASEVLSGKRSLSKAQIRKLAQRFNVSAALFV